MSLSGPGVPGFPFCSSSKLDWPVVDSPVAPRCPSPGLGVVGLAAADDAVVDSGLFVADGEQPTADKVRVKSPHHTSLFTAAITHSLFLDTHRIFWDMHTHELKVDYSKRGDQLGFVSSPPEPVNLRWFSPFACMTYR